MTAPWPLVDECHGHAHPSIPTESCKQCDGRHRHVWVTWKALPHTGPAMGVRCEVCGGRKCDRRECFERRHHLGPHIDIDGRVIQEEASNG